MNEQGRVTNEMAGDDAPSEENSAQVVESDSAEEEKTEPAEEPKKTRTTRLVIEKNLGLKLNTESGQPMEAKQISIGRRYFTSQSYYNLKNLSKTERVEVLIRDSNEIYRADLPEKMLDRLADFIREKENIQECFDCSSFVYGLNDIPNLSEEPISDKWRVQRIAGESQLIPGDSVMILGDKTEKGFEVEHFAIYIGEGLYLSKFGDEGPMIAATREEMQNFYGKDGFACKITPKDGQAHDDELKETIKH